MSNIEKEMWLTTAAGWKQIESLLELNMKQGLEPAWCKMKIQRCRDSYNYCMLRATDSVTKIETAKELAA
jgi:hypothetical protein